MRTVYQGDNHTVKEMTHADGGDFWSTLGPFMASRSVRKELGIAISSDNNYSWLITFDTSGAVVAFAAIEFCNGAKAIFRHAYVIESVRERGLYKRLLALREDCGRERGIERVIVTTNRTTSAIIEKAGYTEIGKRGQYTTWEKTL